MKQILLIGCIALYLLSPAQRYEIGVSAGGTNYLGDLSPRLVAKNARESAGFFLKKNMTQYWSFRLGYTYAKIIGSDDAVYTQNLRNLSFYNNLNEFAAIFEFNFKPYAIGNLPNKETFYVMHGIAFTMHSPKAEYGGNTYALRTLKTEGKSYMPFTIAIPFGMGYKLNLNQTWILAPEIGFRMTFTDYLDDVSGVYPDLNGMSRIAAHMSDRSVERSDVPLSSLNKQRGDVNPVDWYAIAGIHLSYRIKPSPCYHF